KAGLLDPTKLKLDVRRSLNFVLNKERECEREQHKCFDEHETDNHRYENAVASLRVASQAFHCGSADAALSQTATQCGDTQSDAGGDSAQAFIRHGGRRLDRRHGSFLSESRKRAENRCKRHKKMFSHFDLPFVFNDRV